MKKTLSFLFSIILFCTNQALSQISFSDQTSALLPQDSFYSGVAMGIADMNGDGLDDLVRLNDARILTIDHQQSDSSMFESSVYTTPGSGSEWSLSIADVDSNGYNDILVGGAFNGLKLFKANETGDDYSSSILNNPIVFLQGSNFVDIDNDGAIDIFACHDVGISAPFVNDGMGNFSYDLDLINTASTIPSDNSGNYGSVWTDYDNDGDIDLYLSKCRQGVTNPLDGRRVNLLFQNDGDNNFTDVAEAAGLRPLAQSWAADFADVDNDGDLDCFIINHDKPNGLYKNNGDGTFTDVTLDGIPSPFAGIGGGIQCIFDDFDNDGLVDLLVTSYSGGSSLFMNTGNFIFEAASGAIPTNPNMQSATVGDLNNDGKLDIYAGYAFGFNSPNSFQPDRLFINETETGNYLDLLLKGQDMNLNAIGARVEIYGEWGIQVREVRAGESYGITTSFGIHFGLGEETMVDSLKIRWPDGTEEMLCGISANQKMNLEQLSLPNLLTSGFEFTEDDLELSFIDTTQGVATEWLWDFGDGQTSTEQNPVHTYADDGPYTITLTASNECESSVETMVWPLLALPVDLLDFSAALTSPKTVTIKWISENEYDFDYYELERTVDFRNIESLTKVPGAQKYNYEWLDQHPTNGTNYYRLKQVDLDGAFVYSDWEAVNVSTTHEKIKAFPNPAVDRLMIQTGTNHVESVMGYNATGKKVFYQENLSGSFDIAIDDWESGIYFLQVTTNQGLEMVRFIKL